jgi:hypothetical protein
MKYLMFLTALILSSKALALEQYWIEEKNGVRHACYSPGFWAMIGGTRQCSPFNGETPPDRNALRVAATAPPEERVNYDAAQQRITAARAERTAIERNIRDIERSIGNLNRTDHPCRNVAGFQANEECRERHRAQIEDLQGRLRTEQSRLAAARGDVQVVDNQLQIANAETRPVEERARLANQIIANKDVLDRLDRLNGRLSDSDETLKAIERAYSRTMLEAYVYQKMKKMAANICKAQSKCPADNDALNQLMEGVFDSSRIEADAKAPTGGSNRRTSQ